MENCEPEDWDLYMEPSKMFDELHEQIFYIIFSNKMHACMYVCVSRICTFSWGTKSSVFLTAPSVLVVPFKRVVVVFAIS
jgi:hypothetical protein